MDARLTTTLGDGVRTTETMAAMYSTMEARKHTAMAMPTTSELPVTSPDGMTTVVCRMPQPGMQRSTARHMMARGQVPGSTSAKQRMGLRLRRPAAATPAAICVSTRQMAKRQRCTSARMASAHLRVGGPAWITTGTSPASWTTECPRSARPKCQSWRLDKNRERGEHTLNNQMLPAVLNNEALQRKAPQAASIWASATHQLSAAP
mmetsp:Transcript_45849/g.146395  ORF Transcript_45849/g.146395 Transcript_45849/m.146395 type:complete len:206 (-) Transcript_45849:31-648(-)